MTEESNGFTALRKANIARQREWPNAEKINPAFRALELAGEAGELCNVVKKLERERLGIPGSRATKDQLSDEIADVVICADLVAKEFDIDVWPSTRRKFNADSKKNKLSTRLDGDEPMCGFILGPMAAQGNEFLALRQLTEAYHRLPPVVDDDYPEMRHYYERALRDFIDALRTNGRIA